MQGFEGIVIIGWVEICGLVVEVWYRRWFMRVRKELTMMVLWVNGVGYYGKRQREGKEEWG